MSRANVGQLNCLVGHSIRVLLAGAYVDGFVQPNGGWITVWVEDDQDEWAAIQKAVGDVRRVIRYVQNPSPCEDCKLRTERGSCHLLGRKLTMIECQGKCKEHRGTIKRVEVRDIRNGKDWGLFSYCDEAIDEDIRRGLDVSILDYVPSVNTGDTE